MKPANFVDIDIKKLKKFFRTHTLGQCAKEFGCSSATIKRKLKAAGVDTSIHNNSRLAKDLFKKSKKDTSFLTENFLYDQYIIQNKDSKTIAEENKLHYNTVRNRIQKYGLKKSAKNVSASMMVRHYEKTGYMHPGQRPDVINKINKRRSRYYYKPAKSSKNCLFKSLHELCYALLLDNDDDVESWDYELIKIPYIDRLTGRHRMYYVDFSVQAKSGDRWVEVKPAENMIPHDKYLYASQAAKQAGIMFRGLIGDEKSRGYELFKSGYMKDNIEFRNIKDIKNDKNYTLWFKNINEVGKIKHDHYVYKEEVGPYVRVKLKAKAKNKSGTSNTYQCYN